MKRNLLTTALGFVLAGALTGTAALAQQTQTTPNDTPNGNAPYHHRHHGPPNPQRQAEFVSKKLNLTPEKTAQLTPIFASQDQQFQALRQNTSLTPEQRHEQMRAIHQSTEQQLATVLTPDQLQQLKAMHHNHHGNWQHNPNAQGQPATPPSGL